MKKYNDLYIATKNNNEKAWVWIVCNSKEILFETTNYNEALEQLNKFEKEEIKEEKTDLKKMVSVYVESYKKNMEQELNQVLTLLKEKNSIEKIEKETGFNRNIIEEIDNRYNIEYTLNKFVKNRMNNIKKAIEKMQGDILTVRLNRNLEGMIQTTNGTYKFYTIQAQGDIQRLHNRFIVKKVK